ncbi:MAG: guanylate kinase [Coriobacteriales bacterium]|jgi:guanylate kinase
MPGSLFVISGPSGAGKGTLVSRVVKRIPSIWVSVSATTRAPRVGEVDGVSYVFMSTEEFERTIKEGGFVEWARVHEHYYGTPVAPIKEHLEKGDDVLLEIDVQGAFQVREKFPDAKLVFIAPPSMEVLEQRLRGRATDSEEEIARRLVNARGEMEASSRYDEVIVNDDLDRATDMLVKVLES